MRHWLAVVMKKRIHKLLDRMQKFRKAIQAYNRICNSMSRAHMHGFEQVDRVLNNLRGHASNAYNRIISSVKGDLSAEVLDSATTWVFSN